MNFYKNPEWDDYVRVKLTDHSVYLDILDRIRKDTDKIIIVQTEGVNNRDKVVNTALEMMPLEKKEAVSEWLGTVQLGGGKAMLYVFKKKREFFEFLSGFESFYLDLSVTKILIKKTSFGYDDIAFIDKNAVPVFWTITHEGEAFINKRYMADDYEYFRYSQAVSG